MKINVTISKFHPFRKDVCVRLCVPFSQFAYSSINRTSQLSTQNANEKKTAYVSNTNPAAMNITNWICPVCSCCQKAETIKSHNRIGKCTNCLRNDNSNYMPLHPPTIDYNRTANKHFCMQNPFSIVSLSASMRMFA